MSGPEEHEEAVQQVTEDGGVASDDFEVIGKGSDSSPSERKDSDRLPPLWILPVLLGVFILAFNIAVFIQPSLRWMVRPTGYVSAVSFILAATSMFVGLFLIVYAIVLRRSERSKIPPGSRTHHRPRQDLWYVKWVVVPLLLGLLAPLATVWVVDYYGGFYQPSLERRNPASICTRQRSTFTKMIRHSECRLTTQMKRDAGLTKHF